MSVSAITSAKNSPVPIGEKSPVPAAKAGVRGQPSSEDVRKAASQFEAIIVRQLLAPAIEPAMKGMGGDSGGGGGMYSYLLTDALANNLSQGQGMGLGKMLEKQFSAPPVSHSVTSSTALKLQSNSTPSP